MKTILALTALAFITSTSAMATGALSSFLLLGEGSEYKERPFKQPEPSKPPKQGGFDHKPAPSTPRPSGAFQSAPTTE